MNHICAKASCLCRLTGHKTPWWGLAADREEPVISWAWEAGTQAGHAGQSEPSAEGLWASAQGTGLTPVCPGRHLQQELRIIRSDIVDTEHSCHWVRACCVRDILP